MLADVLLAWRAELDEAEEEGGATHHLQWGPQRSRAHRG